MKNIQLIDATINCVYDVFEADEEDFGLIFTNRADIAFIDEIYANGDKELLDIIFNKLWTRRLKNPTLQESMERYFMS